MTDVIFVAERIGNVHNVPIQMGMDLFDAKFDTGSSVTVISLSVFYDGWSEEEISRLERFCARKGCEKRNFKSASGHEISGYPVIAKDVLIGDVAFPIFRYYLIIGGRSEMSLIGDDFIDNCRYSHEPHEDIYVTYFDHDSYGRDGEMALDSDELICMIDEIVAKDN